MSSTNKKHDNTVSDLNWQDVPKFPEHIQSSAASQLRMPVGKVVTVSGSRILILVSVDPAQDQDAMPQQGQLICIETPNVDLVTQVAGLSSPSASMGEEEEGSVLIAELEILGEIRLSDKGGRRFSRGITAFPSLGQTAALLTREDLALVYGLDNREMIKIGDVSGNEHVPAQICPDVFLRGNFSLFGVPNAGKSCALAVIVRALVKGRNPARIVLFDEHDEYSNAFGQAANTFSALKNMVALWMLDFRELTYLLETIGGALTKIERDILSVAIVAAKKKYNKTLQDGDRAQESSRVQVGDLTPYRMADVLTIIEKAHLAKGTKVYQDLQSRLERAMKSSQFLTLFGNVSSREALNDFISNVFRIPMNSKPISVISLAGLDRELRHIIVSVVSRFARLIANDVKGRMPLLLLLEDAHEYLPEVAENQPVSTRVLQDILAESSKVSLSVGLVSHQIQAVSAEAIEHCNTMFAMRVTNRKDQAQITDIIPETANGLLSSIGVIDRRECVAVGAGVPVPMRLSFDSLPAEMVPREKVTSNDDLLELLDDGEAFVDRLLANWRGE